MSDPLTARQRQTLAARQAFADRFTSPEERTEHYRALGRKSAATRLVLSRAAMDALADAYALLGRVVAQERPESSDLQVSRSEPDAPETSA